MDVLSILLLSPMQLNIETQRGIVTLKKLTAEGSNYLQTVDFCPTSLESTFKRVLFNVITASKTYFNVYMGT